MIFQLFVIFNAYEKKYFIEQFLADNKKCYILYKQDFINIHFLMPVNRIPSYFHVFRDHGNQIRSKKLAIPFGKYLADLHIPSVVRQRV